MTTISKKRTCFIAFLLLAFCSGAVYAQKITFVDKQSGDPVSFATISFGNGLGSFADADGMFLFQKKRYADVDSLFVSAIGYRELRLSTEQLKETYEMEEDIGELEEVVITAPKKGKYKKREVKPISHTNYFHSWLPTVESEVAVRFNREEGNATQLETLLLPINIEENVGGRKTQTRSFSTLFRVTIYENKDSVPGREIPYGNIVFTITEEDKKEVYELDLASYSIFIPEEGFFVSVQVLGTTDAKGNLLQTKKYNEIKTKQGVKKISITFRPLLPFTDEISGEKTYVRRIFFNNRQWQPFNFEYNPNSELLRRGYKNYGMGAKLRVYKD